MTNDIKPLYIVKGFIILVILYLTFFTIAKPFQLLDNKFIKILLLLGILIVMYYDLHTGILLNIAFLLMLINLNSIIMEQNLFDKDTKLEQFLPLLHSKIETEVETHVESEKATSTIDCVDNEKKENISENILDYQVDTKVRPYEVFVKMITSNEQLEMASNSAVLTI
jgi:hypothetical protein